MNKETMPVLTCVCFILIAIMNAWLRDDLKREAVERGFAEWISDSAGNTTWQWKEAK